jgi:hypothetical protein
MLKTQLAQQNMQPKRLKRLKNMDMAIKARKTLANLLHSIKEWISHLLRPKKSNLNQEERRFSQEEVNQLIAQARRNVMKKAKLGSGARFKAGSEAIQKKEGLSKKSADAVMAVAGRKKYGAKKMANWAAKGKKK